jgi:hypothetical protein
LSCKRWEAWIGVLDAGWRTFCDESPFGEPWSRAHIPDRRRRDGARNLTDRRGRDFGWEPVGSLSGQIRIPAHVIKRGSRPSQPHGRTSAMNDFANGYLLLPFATDDYQELGHRFTASLSRPDALAGQVNPKYVHQTRFLSRLRVINPLFPPV